MAARTFTANFIGRTSNLEKSFKRVSKGSSLMSDNLMRTTRMAGIGFAALGGVVIGAAAALKPMIDKAASMEEALSKNQLLLGESSKAVEAFAETSLHSFGVTNLAALQATGVFASLGDAMGMSEAASASMATTLTGLAGDLSSLHDVDVETALTALRAGLIGEAEPLRKLGILLDAATIKSKALTMGLVKNTKDALTPAIKSQAAYALILEKGATAMGDFARTSDSATNATKVLAGEWEQLQVKIGTAILPFYTAMINHLVDVILPAVNEFWDDPTWTRGAKTAGEAAQNSFVKGFAGFTLALAGAVMSPAGLVFAQVVDLARRSGEEAHQALAAAIGGAGAGGALDRPPDVRGGGGAAQADILTTIADLENAAAAIEAAAAAAAARTAAEPTPGLSQAEKDAMTAAAVAAAIQAALDAAAAPAAVEAVAAAVTVGPTMEQLTGTIDTAVAAAVEAVAAAATVGPTMEQLTGTIDTAVAAAVEATVAALTTADVGPTVAQLTGATDISGDGAVSTAESDLEKFLKVVGTSDWAAFVGGGPPNTQITINASAVSGQEVVEALGAHVDMNGPLPPHWQQGAQD